MTTSSDDVRNLSTQALDALREVANIGAGHAATALSEITGQRIMISVPRINVTAIEDVPNQVGAGEFKQSEETAFHRDPAQAAEEQRRLQERAPIEDERVEHDRGDEQPEP